MFTIKKNSFETLCKHYYRKADHYLTHNLRIQ